MDKTWFLAWFRVVKTPPRRLLDPSSPTIFIPKGIEILKKHLRRGATRFRFNLIMENQVIIIFSDEAVQGISSAPLRCV